MKPYRALGATALSLILALVASCSSGTAAESTKSSAPESSAPESTSQASTPQEPASPDVVTLRHSWIPDDIMLPIVVAKEKGFYSDENIELQDQVGDGSATAAKLVANGDVMIGTGEASTVLVSRSNGMDIVNIATQFQKNSTVLAFLKSSGIKDWKDLKGKKISISFTSAAYAALLAALQNEGVSPDEVQFVNLPAGSADSEALRSGQIDVACVFIANIASWDFGDQLDMLSFADAGVTWPSTGYFVSAKTVKENGELLTRWLKATMKGLQYTIDNPEESAQLMTKAYPDVDADVLLARWKMDVPYVTSPISESNGLGYQDPDAWEKEAADLLAGKIIETAVESTDAFTNEFIEKAHS